MTVPKNSVTLRRLVITPFMVGSLLLLAACGNDDETNPDTDAAETETGAEENDAPEENGADDDAAEPDPSGEEIAFTEVQENDSPDSCWAVIDQTVYDLTGWIDQHPGGADRIEQLCGTDATDQFTQQHSGDEGPEGQLAEFEIGAVGD